jgi:hypothetical protein
MKEMTYCNDIWKYLISPFVADVFPVYLITLVKKLTYLLLMYIYVSKQTLHAHIGVAYWNGHHLKDTYFPFSVFFTREGNFFR